MTTSVATADSLAPPTGATVASGFLPSLRDPRLATPGSIGPLRMASVAARLVDGFAPG